MKEELLKSKRKAILRKILGTFIFLIGAVFVLNSFTIKGNSIFDKIEEGISLGFGLILVVVGLAVFILVLKHRMLKMKLKLKQVKESENKGDYSEVLH